jgi:hypothetical protein
LSSAFPTQPAHGSPTAWPLPLPFPDGDPSQVLSYGPEWFAPFPLSELCEPSQPWPELPGPAVAVEPLPLPGAPVATVAPAKTLAQANSVATIAGMIRNFIFPSPGIRT